MLREENTVEPHRHASWLSERFGGIEPIRHNIFFLSFTFQARAGDFGKLSSTGKFQMIAADHPDLPQVDLCLTFAFSSPSIKEKIIFFRFHFSVFSLVLVSIEKINQALKKVFDHISKHIPKARQKYCAVRRKFNYLLGVWKCDQTRSFMF